MIKVKSIDTNRFWIELTEHGSHYVVTWCWGDVEHTTGYINDYLTASALFDYKLAELVGH